ncbi:MAG: helix-turn-helix transcriptional regulator [Ruminococcaceae bacterium]|nr:helix-turn-helix transcriptional regulator [Oscillospiraceae bacterium]
MRKYFNRLRDLREDSDKTQMDMAVEFEMQPTQYRRYENGESDLPLELAKKFADYYGVSIDYIAMRTDKK